MAAAIITKPTFTLTDRLRFQQDCIRRRDYIAIGKLTSVVWEGQRNTMGFSSERSPAPQAFSKWQRKTWASLTLDWLNHKNAPVLAVSRDRNDLLLPFGISPLPDIPDPRWPGPKVAPGAHSSENPTPRIPQLLAGCPVVGDRACGRITDRISGKTYLIFQPLTELMVLCGRGKDSGFGRVRWGVDPSEHTHGALLVNADPKSDGTMEAYFVGGSFTAG